MGEDLRNWHDVQPPAAWDGIYKCLSGSHGKWTSTCDIKLNLDLSIGCGGTNGPEHCYQGFVDDAIRSAEALEVWAVCIHAGATAQAQADAEKARKDAEEAARNQPAPTGGSGSSSGNPSPSGSAAGGGSGDSSATETKRREEEKQQRDSQVRAVYDAKSEEIARRNRLAARWESGVQRQQQELATQRQMGIDLLNSIEGGGNTPSGASWRLHTFLGFGGFFFPIYTDATGVDITSFSTVSPAGGMGFQGSLEAWPYFGPHFGIGLLGEGALAWFPTINGSAIAYEGYFGARGFVGKDGGLSLLLEAGHAWRRGGHSSDIGGGVADAYQTGTASYGVTRLGLGGRLCVWEEVEDPRFCMGGVDVVLFMDLLGDDAMATKTRPLVVRAGLWGRGMVVLSADVGFSYPAAGAPKYATDDHDGTFALLRLEKGWDWFGDPYGETAAQRKRRLDRKKELEGGGP